jgi:hypothetical protein
MTGPVTSLARRAPRIRTTERTPAVLRFQSGDCVQGRLEVFSSTGGLLCLSKPLIRGTRIKVMFLTQTGPVMGAAEMLTPVSWTQQPFRFVALASGDQRRLQSVTGCSPRVEMPTPKPISRTVDRVEIPTPQPISRTFDAEPDWIDKYRAAISSTPPRRRLLDRMRDALTLGTK